MVTIEELKLGNKTLEALKFLLLQINELDVILNELNFEELREANTQAKTQIEVLNNIKTLVLNTKKSIEQVKASIDSRSEEINTTKREIEDAKTNIIKAKDDTTLIYENISSKSERIEQKYNDIAEIKKEVDRKFDDIKSIENQSRDIANEIANNKNITLRKIDENINTLNNTISNINILKSETLQEIATTKAGIDTKANEALNTATSSLNEIKTILNDFKGKQAELNALKASLETLKSSLESLNKSGLINDTQAGIAQTYSSNKINNLLQGVLRESDASEGNANGKLVKRNAQGNIYATNVYLNATTKAEVSDIKSSLATDKWRFIVRDTGEGLLRSMSIKDFINSQEVDAYGKTESDNRYLAKSEASTDNASNTLVKRGADGNISINNIKISDTGSDIEMIRDIERDTQSPYQFLIRKSKDEPIKLMNLQNFIGRLNYYNFNNTQERIEKSYWYIPDRWQSSVRGEYDYIRAKTNEYLCLNSLKLLGKDYKGTDPTPKAADFWNSQNTSFAVLTKDGEYDVLGKCSLATLDDRIKEKATKAVQDSGSFIQEKVNSAIVEKQTVKKLRNDVIDLKQAVNFIVELTSATYYLIKPASLTQEIIGQSGVIVVKGARFIREWSNFIKWREIPTDLKETEVFAYFVASANEVYMGRA